MPFRLMVPPRQWYSQRMRSVSHTSSDQDQYQDASEYLDLDIGTLSLSSSSPTKEHAPENAGESLEDVDDDDDDVSNAHFDRGDDNFSNMDMGEDAAQCHAPPPLSDDAVVAGDASPGSSYET